MKSKNIKNKRKFYWHELIDRKFVLAYIVLALVLLISQVMFAIRPSKAAGPYYVDATLGLDTNPGTLALPWKTVAKVNVAGLIPGDQVYFKRGEIFIGSLKPDYNGIGGSPIVYSDYGNPLDNPPIIRKDPALFSYVLSIREGRHDINITNLQFDGGVGCNQIIQLFNSLDTSTVSNILIDNVVLNGPYWGIRAGGGSYVNITMSNLSFPGITSGQWGIDFSNTVSSSDITISNVTLNGTNQAIVFGAINGLNISNSTITGNTASAITLGHATIASSDISITDCDLSTNGASSLRLTGNAISNVVLDHVIANNNGQHGINATAVISGTNEIKNFSEFNNNLSNGIYIGDISNLTITDTEASENHNGVRGIDGITFYGNTSNITLNRVTALNNGQHGIQINTPTGSNIDILNSTFNGNGTYTVTKGNGISFTGTGDDANITDVTSSNNGGDGFNIHGNWTHVNFIRCTAEDNGTLIVGPGGDGDGFSYHDNTSGIMSYCISRNNKKSAVAHIGNSLVDMNYNLFSHTTNGRIALVYLEAGGTGTYNLYHNVIYSGGEGLSYPSTLINSGATATIKNNIIFADGADASAKGIIGNPSVTEDYNIVYGADTLFTGAINHGTNSSIQSDPKFVNASLYDFHLQPSSPAIDAGIDLGLGYNLDFEGLRAPVGDFDMGAYEYPLGIFRSTLNQYKTDGITQILPGVWTDEDTVVFKFQMDSRDNPDSLTPQIELRPLSNIFIDTATHTALVPVPFSGAPAWAAVTASGLTSGESYHWQARFTNPTIDGAWMPMGGSPDFKVDFVDPTFTEVEGVDPLPPVPTDTINYLVADASSGVNVLDLTVKYGFSADAVCDATDNYGNSFTSGVDFIISGVHSDHLCLTAADNAGNIAYHYVGQLHTTLPDSAPPTFIVNDGVSLTQTTSDMINVTVNDPNLDPTTVKYAFSSDAICNAGDTYSTLFTSGISFTILPTHNDYLCLVASDLYAHTDYYPMGKLNVVPTIITGGPTELAAPVDSVPACVAVDIQENNAVVKAIDWKFTDNSYDEIGFRLYDSSDLNNFILEVVEQNINSIQEKNLAVNTAYTRVVKAYKSTITSSATSPATCYTLANVPKKPTISQTTADSLTLKLDNTDGNPLGTKYAIEEVKSHQYINGNGLFTATPVWLTYEQWGGENGVTVWGTRPSGIIAQIIKMALQSSSEYAFAVKAQNGDGIETVLSENTSGSTSSPAPANANVNQPPVVPPTNTNQPPVAPPPLAGEVPIVPPAINGNLNVPIEPEPGLNENINQQPEIPGTINANINQAPAEVEPLPIPIIGQILEVFDNPDVEQVSESLVMPILITVAAVNTVPAVIILTLYLLPYLHLIFLEPLLLIFRKKRQKWGVVYNSLTKLSVDLALVRLYNKKTNQLVQTKVTDRQGRYVIIAKEPGKYYLSVTKPGFVSPTNLLKDEKQDTKYIDLYHGEPLEVTAKDAVLTANIPLDPVEKKSLAFGEVIRSYALKNLRLIISYAGLILALVVVLIVPTAFTIGALIFHFIFFLAFRRFLVPAKPKSWGIVYDAKTKTPLGSSVIRIFDLKFNKLLETQVTDAKGRYSFLVGKNQYQLLAEKPGYQNKEVKPIDLVKNEDIVNLDVKLNKV